MKKDRRLSLSAVVTESPGLQAIRRVTESPVFQAIRQVTDLMRRFQLTPEQHIRLTVEIQSDAQSWRLLRQLRSRLEGQGFTREEALAVIVEMAQDDRAVDDRSTREVAIVEMVELYGRRKVGEVLGLTSDKLRKIISRTRPTCSCSMVEHSPLTLNGLGGQALVAVSYRWQYELCSIL
jgi:hypothetical protein